MTKLITGKRPTLSPGMLVRTNYNWKTTCSKLDSAIWVRRPRVDGIIGFVQIDNAVEGPSEPCLYIDVLPEDERFAEILMGEQRVAVRIEILEEYYE